MTNHTNSREIKFRAFGWDGEFTVQDVAENPTLAGYLESQAPALMQYTGLKDKNGVEIYEGDIINIKGVTWYVEFGNGQYVLRCTCHYPDGDFYIFEDSPQYEVIGNVYENKELLNDE